MGNVRILRQEWNQQTRSPGASALARPMLASVT